MSVEPSAGREWNHELAAIGLFAAPDCSRNNGMNVASEPSVGRNCGIGTIRLPRLHRWRLASNSRGRKALSTGTSNRCSECPTAVANKPRISLQSDERAFAIASKDMAPMAVNGNRLCTARNHPVAARFWKHHLAKSAIGWVE